jgi:hypothetical protein
MSSKVKSTDLVPIKKQGTLKPMSKRRYSLNERFFKEIDSPLSAYLLGFAASDGCVRRGYLQFALKRLDREHLEKIKAALGSGAPVHDYEATCNGKRVPYSVLFLHSHTLVADLARHGILPRKSHTIKPWNGPALLLPVYWLGVMDGDGSLYEAKRDKNWRIGLVGNPDMVNGFTGFIHERLGIKAKIEVKGPSLIASYRKLPELHFILRLLYDNPPLCLERKRQLAEVILARQPRCVYHDWSQYTEEDFQEFHRTLGSWEKVAAHFGMTRSAISSLRWARRKKSSN